MHVDINKKVSIMSYVFEIQQRHSENIMSWYVFSAFEYLHAVIVKR